jgi:hypothetical protein
LTKFSGKGGFQSLPDPCNTVILSAVSVGDVTPQEAVSIMAVVEQFRRTLEITELEARIATLEANNAA